MVTMGTIEVAVDLTGVNAFRKECIVAAASLGRLQEMLIILASRWGCEQCGKENEGEHNACAGCGATR